MSRKWPASVWFSVVALLLCFVHSGSAFAEDPTEESELSFEDSLAQQQRDARDAEEAESRAAFLAELNEIGAPDARSVTLAARAEDKFLKAGTRLEPAILTLRTSIDSGDALDKAAKNLEKLASDMSAYFVSAQMRPPDLDRSGLSRLGQASLVHETLASAEHVLVSFKRAADIITETHESDTVSVESLRFLQTFHGELLRLRLLASKIKSTRKSVEK